MFFFFPQNLTQDRLDKKRYFLILIVPPPQILRICVTGKRIFRLIFLEESVLLIMQEDQIPV